MHFQEHMALKHPLTFQEQNNIW